MNLYALIGGIVLLLISCVAICLAGMWTIAWINLTVKFLGQMINKEKASIEKEYSFMPAILWAIAIFLWKLAEITLTFSGILL